MRDFAEECLRLLKDGHFEITNSGPLHQPIRRFSIRRDEKLQLILETQADPNARSSSVEQPPGTVRMSWTEYCSAALAGLKASSLASLPTAL